MKTAKILPRMSAGSLACLDENENLLTSSAYRLLQLAEVLQNELGFDTVIAENNTTEHDVIISRWMGDDIHLMDKSKPIYEFHYCGLNGGWFFERYTYGDSQIELSKVDYDSTKAGLKYIFYSTEVIINLIEENL